MSTFAALGVPPELARSLDERGIRAPFPIQAAAIPDMLAGRDLSGRAPTGSGKTIAFGIPLVFLHDVPGFIVGSAVEKPFPSPPSAEELFGHAVHHALRARFCVERGRLWHAEYWLSALRDCALHIACLRRGLPAVYGRGFDDLPGEVRDGFADALVGTLERDELLRALACAVEGLLRESAGVEERAAQVAPRLRALL